MLSVLNIFFLILSLIPFVQSSFPALTWSTRISLNTFGLPLLQICKKHVLLLDTGSKDSWLAGLSCQGCPERTSLCPEGREGREEIKYFKGSVRGDAELVSMCLGAYRFVCANQAEGMEQVGAAGILGARGATGKGIVRALLQAHQIQQESFAVYRGHQENRLFLGEIPKQFIKEKVRSVSSGEWQAQLEGMRVCGKLLSGIENYSIFFDTGANILILPPPLFSQTRSAVVQQMKRIGCAEEAEHLSFSCKVGTLVQEEIVLFLGKESELRLPMRDLLKVDGSGYKFKIQRGSSSSSSSIIMGVSLLRAYIISFELSGSLAIFSSNRELLEWEVANFKIVLLEYVLFAIGLAVLAKKGYQIVEVTINRKIVI